MGVTFNADEVFEMAEQIERNGAVFYREVANKASGQAMKDMFLGMAAMEDAHLQMEDAHLQTFQEMRKELSAQEKTQTTYDPYNEATLYLQALADSKGFEGMKGPAVKLSGNESMQELLEASIDAEKNSVLFYVGLKDLVSAKTGKDKRRASASTRVSQPRAGDVLPQSCTDRRTEALKGRHDEVSMHSVWCPERRLPTFRTTGSARNAAPEKTSSSRWRTEPGCGTAVAAGQTGRRAPSAKASTLLTQIMGPADPGEFGPWQRRKFIRHLPPWISCAPRRPHRRRRSSSSAPRATS